MIAHHRISSRVYANPPQYYPATLIDIAITFYERMVSRTMIALTPGECNHICDYALACATRYWRMYHAD